MKGNCFKLLQTDINVYSQTWFLIKKSVSIISSITSVYQSILGLSTKLLHAYWVSGSAGPALVAEDHGQGHMSLKGPYG